MVVPEAIVDAAQDGDVATVRNWLDSNDVNDTDRDGCGLLTSACAGYQNGFEVLRLLLERGIDVNQQKRAWTTTALHIMCFYRSLEGVQLLLQYGADVNRMIGEAPVVAAHTPLSLAAGDLDYLGISGDVQSLSHRASATARSLGGFCRDAHEVMLVLLSAGAALGTGGAWGAHPETMLERLIGDNMGNTRQVILAKIEMKLSRDLLKAVRAAGGTWRKYCLVPPKKLLRLRSLHARGRARLRVSARAARANAKMRPIVWLMSPNVPNEIAWRVLEFWNPRSDGTKYHTEY